MADSRLSCVAVRALVLAGVSLAGVSGAHAQTMPSSQDAAKSPAAAPPAIPVAAIPDTPAPDTPAPAATQDAATQDIVVTAQRRSERIQNVPISINVVNEDALTRAGVTRLEDISRVVPAVQVSRTGVYTQPSVRGITTLQASTVENNVATYIDGFYQVSSRSLNLDLMNIAGIEVLKGPQGTLFGRNATGGALLINTLQPSFSEASGRISLGYGSFDDKRAQGYVSVPLSQTVAVNVAGSYRQSDGYIHDIAGFDTAPLDLYTIDSKIRFKPTDALNITAGFRWNEGNDGRGLAITEEGHTLAALYAPTFPIETGDNRTSLTHPVINKFDQYTGTLKAEYDAGPVTLTSLSMYQKELDYTHFETDGTPAPVYDQYYDERFRTLSQEVNVRSNGGGALQYVVGVYYFDTRESQIDSYSALLSTTYTKQPTIFQSTKAIAGYADLTWRVADRLFLTGGLRYSHEVRQLMEYSGVNALVYDGKARYDAATPRAVVRYQLTPGSNVYASFSQGFKSGFINTTAPFTSVDPEKLNAYEIGYKTAHNGFSFATAAYYYDYRDLQASALVLINGSQNNVTANAATARIYGAEASLTAPLTSDFLLGANLAYTHARYTDFRNAVVSLPSPTTGLNSAICGTGYCTQNWSGLQIARAPDWSGNVNGTYTIHAGRSRIALSANVAFTSSYLPTKSDIGLNGTGYRYQQGGYALLTLQAAWTLPGDHVTLSAFGNNVTNQRYYIVKTSSAFGDYHVFGEPASWGLRADYRF